MNGSISVLPDEQGPAAVSTARVRVPHPGAELLVRLDEDPGVAAASRRRRHRRLEAVHAARLRLDVHLLEGVRLGQGHPAIRLPLKVITGCFSYLSFTLLFKSSIITLNT